MDKSTLRVLINNLGSPAFALGENGEVLYKNRYMSYIRQRLNKPELYHFDEMDITFDDILDDCSWRFHVTNSELAGFMYYVVASDGEKISIFIFDNDIVKSNLIENVIEHIDEIVVIFNQDGILQRMNSICDQILPFERRDVIGKPISKLVEMGLVEEPIIDRLIETKEKIYKDIVYPNGKIISYTAIPLFGSTGNFKGGVLTGRDISRIINLAKNLESDNSDSVEYISVNKEIEEIKNVIARIAPSDTSVFIMGESGVGKEILTRSIWKQSKRRDMPFVEVNCAAIPSELIESELFGYEKGAFTGANAEGKVGLIESADGGTMFLDEIGEMPLETQKKLLRVLQEKSVQRIGGLKPKKVDVRFISATNKTMEEIQNPEIFRLDLYYRLSVIPLSVPPLRERIEDVGPICQYYMDFFNHKYGRKVQLMDEALKVLEGYKWPGNIRELKNIVERIIVLSPYEKISAEQMRRTLGLGTMGNIDGTKISTVKMNYASEEDNVVINDIMNIEDAYRLVEEFILNKAISKYGNVTKAAQAVGINPSTVYRKIKNGKLTLADI